MNGRVFVGIAGVIFTVFCGCSGGPGQAAGDSGLPRAVPFAELVKPDGSAAIHAPAEAGYLEVVLAEDAVVGDLTVGATGLDGVYILDLKGHTLTIRGDLDIQGGALVLHNGGAIDVDGGVTIAGSASIVQAWTAGHTTATTLKIAGSWTAEGFADLGSAVRFDKSENESDRFPASGYGLVGMLQLPGLATPWGANLLGMETGVFYQEGDDAWVSLGIPVAFGTDGRQCSVETEGLFEIWLRTAGGGEIRPAERKVGGLSGHSWGSIEHISFRFPRAPGDTPVEAVVIRVGDVMRAFLARKQAAGAR